MISIPLPIDAAGSVRLRPSGRVSARFGSSLRARAYGRPRARLALAAAAAAVFVVAGVSAARADSGGKMPYAHVLDGPGHAVVAVRYQMRPKERPKGGEGPKIRKITAGIVAGRPGQVLINASSFPDPDDGPDSIEPFDFKIVLEGGREVDAEIAGLARDLNMAVLRARKPEDVPVTPVKFDRSNDLGIGDEVIIVGLLAEPYSFRHAAYRAHLNGQPSPSKAMYSLDTTLPDLCGGGLVTTPDGKPVGFVGLDPLPEAWENGEPGNLLSLFGSANQGQRPGYLMVYSAAMFADVMASPPPIVDEVPENRGWLGVTMQPLSRDLADYWGIDSAGGVVIGAVLNGSPAEVAGLQRGDVIVAIDGNPLEIHEQKDLWLMQKLIRRAGAGKDIPMRVWRDGEEHDIMVRLTSSPTTIANAEEYQNEDFGITVRELTYDVLQTLNLAKDTKGVYVSKTERAGWAQVSGVDRGDIVQKVDGQVISDLASFKAALGQARTDRRIESSFLVLRNYKTRFVRVQTSWK